MVTAAAVELLVVTADAVAVISTFVIAVATVALRFMVVRGSRLLLFVTTNSPKCQGSLSSRLPLAIPIAVPLTAAPEPNYR